MAPLSVSWIVWIDGFPIPILVPIEENSAEGAGRFAARNPPVDCITDLIGTPLWTRTVH